MKMTGLADASNMRTPTTAVGVRQRMRASQGAWRPQSRAGRHGRNYRAIAFWPLLSCSCPLCRAIADAAPNAITCPMKARPYIGQSVPRLEDPPLVRGRGRFAGDISFPHQLHMRVARSPVAHGRIVAIDAAAARATPGVVAVWTAADIADVPPIDFREGRIERL